MIGGKWTGIAQAMENVALLGKELGNEEVLLKAIAKVAKPLLADIQRDAPRSSGSGPHMADDFVILPDRETRKAGEAIVLVGPLPPHSRKSNKRGFIAAFHEFGTSKMRATPFIRPNYDSFAQLYGTLMVPELQKQFERVVRKYTKRAAR